ncbi:transcript variant X2 [Nothobranchius furzeri]|uniref:Transcript variant X2 n=1 Tax=Nothobranchius furzeri TaxID=105023 RepID=A0A9D2XAH5_NOTFU|nr:transcript variant X2 [Nothobranchius furzeri]
MIIAEWMGYQRSLWRGLMGGGGVAVVRCSCSDEEVRISFRSDDRWLRWAFARRWFESPRLSTASISSDERATPSDSSDPPPSGRRPVSLISTQSSGYGSSRDDSVTPPQLSAESSNSDLNQNPSPTGGAANTQGSSVQPRQKARSSIHNQNNNNKACAANRASSRRQQASPFIRASMAPNPQLTYLDRVIMEIIETERMYVRDLRMIVEDYLAHIIDHADLSIHPEQVCALFGNIEDIYEFNSELLQDLDMCDNNPVAVARCFVMKSEYFIIYTQYCTNYPNSVAALTECMRNKSLAKFFRDRQASLKCSLPLGSYLLKPVQRILKYHLLLQEIAKHFDPEEEGYEVVEEAIYTMTWVAWYINDMKRKHEHAVRLQEVQSLLLNWRGPDLTTYGELVLEGSFKVHRAKNERTLFLFDRMLLITKRRGEHYIYKTHISCSTLMLLESSKDALVFSVTHYKHPKQPHTFQTKTVEEKMLWAHHIKCTILENHHAVIPQKAKDAIMEMDSKYLPRYWYSPEHLNKPLSDEPPRDTRQGRRQSEPTKQMLKSSKGAVCGVPQHLDKDGASPPQLAVSSSSLGESDVDRLEEERRSRGGSLERLVCSEEEVEEEAGQLDEFLLQDEQEVKRGGFSSSKENDLNGSEPTPEQETEEKLPQEKTSERSEEPEAELFSDLGSETSVSPQKPDGEEPCSAAPDLDAKTLSSGESSEDEEDESAVDVRVCESPSILPSSVLDRAGVIAQHFTHSMKRGSLVQDEARSSPRLPSRTGSSLSIEATDRLPRLNSTSSDPIETTGGMDGALLSPLDDGVFDLSRSIRRRRDSTLSRQDQLLIGKIKTYYENAGNQDAAFTLLRRESLTYIPAGLVRSSVCRLNSVPQDEMVQKTPFLCPDPDSGVLESHGHMVSSHSLDSLKSDLFSTDSGEHQRSRSQSMQDSLSEEEFRPSSEMIKVWEGMEERIARSQREDGVLDPSRPARLALYSHTKGHDPESEASFLGTITEDSTSPSSTKTKASGLSLMGSVKNTLRGFGEENAVLRTTVPRITQRRGETADPREDSDQLDETETSKSRVLSLARRYSQLIKTSKPAVRRHGQASSAFGRKGLACVVEEENSGKPNLTLPLVPTSQVTSLPLSPVEHVRFPGAGLVCRSRDLSPGWTPSRSPLSTPPVIEAFNWPKVHELRSRYSNGERLQKVPVSRSRSIPEQMLEGGLRRHSSSSFVADGASSGASSSEPGGGQNVSQEERSKRLQRANSLDPRLSRQQRRELQRLQEEADQDGYYIAAEAPLTDDPERKIIVMEKLPEPEKEPKESEDDSYIQIRSPTSRERISIMAVIDRCRAYQESDEYKQREGAKTRTKPIKAAAPMDQEESQKSRRRTESTQRSMVKNLREKFQK